VHAIFLAELAKHGIAPRLAIKTEP
jgi:hypothetical protein